MKFSHIWHKTSALFTESMIETKPLIENLSKKVVIKTIETRDGHVGKTTNHFNIAIQISQRKKSQCPLSK